MGQAKKLARSYTKLATAVSLLILFGLPCLFYAYLYQTESSSLESELEVTTSLLTRAIRRNPTLWKYDQETLYDLLRSREGGEQDDSAEIILPNGKLLLEHAFDLNGLTLSRRHDLRDAGEIVGHLIITRSLEPLLVKTAEAFLIAALIAITFFYLLKSLPFRLVKHAEQSLQTTNTFLTKVLEGTTNAILVVDHVGNILMGNNQSSELCGIPLLELKKTPFITLFSESDHDELRRLIDKIQTDRQPFCQIETHLQHSDGRRINIICAAAPLEQDGKIVSAVWTLDDVTARKIAEEEVEKLAYYDPLTALPNRALLNDRLEQILNRAERDKCQAAILFLDLDRFKDINDSLGHNIGDQLLVEVSKRLQEILRVTDTVSRYGGDEFIIVLSNVPKDHVEYITLVARKIMEQVETPIRVHGKELFTSCSIGISVFPLDGRDSQSLLKHADLAMYQAKEQGRKNFKFFSMDLNHKVRERMQLENNLRQALDHKQFFLNYQPKLDLINGKISGIEVLVRWRHPSMGLISPERFISIAEETGIINSLGDWILRTACQQHVEWQKAGLAPPKIAVNLSIRQLQQLDSIKQISAILKESGLEPDQLELELTESCLMESSVDLINKLNVLKELGVQIAIDDFGTGYSSLGYLKHFPVDRLKIDRCFINDITSSISDSKIAQAIIAMGKSLGLEVTAEGVELDEQLSILLKHGCDEIQGYLYSYPLSSQDMGEFLSKEQQSSSPAYFSIAK